MTGLWDVIRRRDREWVTEQESVGGAVTREHLVKEEPLQVQDPVLPHYQTRPTVPH